MTADNIQVMISIISNVTLLVLGIVVFFLNSKNRGHVKIIRIIPLIEPVKFLWLNYNKTGSKLFLTINFILVCAFYYFVFKKKNLLLFITLATTFESFIIYQMLNSSTPVELPEQVFLCCTALIFSFCYCKNLMIELPVFHLYCLPMFWFNSALILYYGGILIIVIMTAIFNEVLFYQFFRTGLGMLQTSMILIGLYYNREET
jgi:hypothetical protein